MSQSLTALLDRRLDGGRGLGEGRQQDGLGLADDPEDREAENTCNHGIVHHRRAADIPGEGQMRSRSQATSGASAGGIG